MLTAKQFDDNCVKMIPGGHDDRPVIHVNSHNFYFNVTYSASFEDVIFDGVNSFARFRKVQSKNVQETAKAVKFLHWPI